MRLFNYPKHKDEYLKKKIFVRSSSQIMKIHICKNEDKKAMYKRFIFTNEWIIGNEQIRKLIFRVWSPVLSIFVFICYILVFQWPTSSIIEILEIQFKDNSRRIQFQDILLYLKLIYFDLTPVPTLYWQIYRFILPFNVNITILYQRLKLKIFDPTFAMHAWMN